MATSMFAVRVCKILAFALMLNVGHSFSVHTLCTASNKSKHSKSTSTSLKETESNVASNIEVELVSTKRRALDVLIFRNLRISPAEYIQKEKAAGDGTVSMSEDEALDHLMSGYDDQGNDIKSLSPESYIAAMLNNIDESGADSTNSPNERHDERHDHDHDHDRQKDVVGCVRVQITKETSAATASFSADFPNIKDDLPPHVFLSNMEVGEMHRRKGIGTKLLSAVSSFAKCQDQEGINLILLDVDNHNIGAINMYEMYGYKYLVQNACYGIMYLDV